MPTPPRDTEYASESRDQYGAARRASPLLQFGLLAVVVLTSRLPFLQPGFGLDSDAWRLADAARYIHDTGVYGASRSPGHPVQELVAAWLWPGGAWFINGTTAALSVVAVVSFAALLRSLRTPAPVLSAFALASVPVVFIHSVDAMDYLWALGFSMVAVLFASRGRSLPAGLFLGLAIGCRLSSILFLLPIALLFLSRTEDGRRVTRSLRFLVSTLLVGGLAYTPYVVVYGWSAFGVYQTDYPRWVFVLKQASLDTWGLVGLTGFAVSGAALAVRLVPVIGYRRLGAGPVAAASNVSAPIECKAWTVFSVVTILLTAVSFLLLPHDAGYLLPAIPFAVLLFALWLPRPAYLLFCVSLLLSPWVLELREARMPYVPSPTARAIPLTVSGWRLQLEPLRGPILYDHERRRSEMRYVQQLIDELQGSGRPQVAVVHDWLPMIRILHGEPGSMTIRFVASMPLDSLRTYQSAGWQVSYLPEAEGPNEQVYGYRLGAHGARLIEPPLAR